MYYSLKIWADHVVCRDTESLNGRDYFALMGGVIVDGTWIPFVFDPISITPTMGRQSWPDGGVVFNGSMRNREIGLVLRGYDIDNNSAWKREREKIKKTMGHLADGVGFVPIIGSFAAKILKAWPLVVDGFVSLDKNDVLLDYSTAITLPELPWGVERATGHPLEVRFKGAQPPIYSDWDYSLHLGFAYRNEYFPSFGGQRAEHTRHPHKESNAQEWVGKWISDRVTCEITRSPQGVALLDVHLTQGGSGSVVQIDDRAVQITPPSEVRLLEQPPRVTGSAGGGRKQSGGIQVTGQVPRVRGLPGASRQTQFQDNPVVTMPQRKPTGADRLILSRDAALEIYALRDRGHPTPLRALRYVRPYTKPSAVAALQVDEYLQWVPM